MKQLVKTFLLSLSIASLIGCATPEHNIKLADSFWQNPKNTVVIAKTKPEDKPQLHSTGQQGFLEMAISAATTKTFNKHIEKTSLNWYHELPQKFVAELKKRHIAAEIFPRDLTSEQKKNATASVQIAGDKLLVLELQKLGAIRNYYSFFPTSAPKLTVF